MGHLLVHITHGPEAPTRAALGLLVAGAAIDEGHEVNVFMAGDAAQLIRDAVLDSLNGLGTGSLRESFDKVVAGGGRFYVSGMSSKARGVSEADLEGKPAEFAMPTRLVQLASRQTESSPTERPWGRPGSIDRSQPQAADGIEVPPIPRGQRHSVFYRRGSDERVR